MLGGCSQPTHERFWGSAMCLFVACDGHPYTPCTPIYARALKFTDGNNLSFTNPNINWWTWPMYLRNIKKGSSVSFPFWLNGSWQQTVRCTHRILMWCRLFLVSQRRVFWIQWKVGETICFVGSAHYQNLLAHHLHVIKVHSFWVLTHLSGALVAHVFWDLARKLKRTRHQ